MKLGIVKFVIPISLYTFLLFIVYWVHINFFEINVIFYAAIFDAFFALIITYTFFYFSSFTKYFSPFEILQNLTICLLIGYSLAISLPTVIDRSLSFYLLEKIKAHNGAVRKSSMRNIFINDYINEYKLIEVRLTEQVESGTLEIRDECIVLTSKGKFIASLSSFFRKNLLAQKRLLLDKYSNVLTDPLKDSHVNVNYICIENDNKD